MLHPMATKTLKPKPRKKPALVPRRRYHQLTRQEQDRLDAKGGEKSLRDYLSEKSQPIPLSEA